MKKITCLSWLLLFSSILWAQDSSWFFVKKIPLNATYFTTDPIGNAYIVQDKNYILKYSKNGDSLGVYNDVRKGEIHQIDANNPLRVLVYYAQYSQITILDNLLSPKNHLDLKRINLFNVPCIANSMDANIWIFDPAGNLLKVDEQLNIRFSTPLRNMINYAVSPCHMVENERALYMVDTTEGILKFDRFGFYKTIYRFKTTELSVFNNHLVYQDGAANKMVSYNTRTLQERNIALENVEDIIQVRYERNRLYVLRKDGLYIYKEN